MAAKRTKKYWRERMRRYLAENPEQLLRQRAYQRAYYAKKKAAVLAQQRARKARLRAAGKCEDCGRKRPQDLAAYCRKCQKARNQKR